METTQPGSPVSFGTRFTAPAPTEEGKLKAINPSNSPEQKRGEETTLRKRIPMSVPRAKLSTPDIPGFRCHWVNDYVGRIEQAQQGGYEFVEREESMIFANNPANATQGVGTDLGSRVSVVVGEKDGFPLRAYLMKIRNEWYQEDQRANEGRVDAIEQATRQGQQDTGGSDGTHRYVKSVSMKSTYSRKG